MSAENRLTLTRARDSRDRVIAALSEHFAHDALDVDEFERRITVAHTSESAEEIDALLSDLSPLTPSTTAVIPAAKVGLAVMPAERVRAEQTMLDDEGMATLYFQVNRNLVNPRITGWVDNIVDHHRTRWLCERPTGVTVAGGAARARPPG